MDFRREPAARAAEGLTVLPPFAPAAETWARTMVLSNIWIRCADVLIEASVSKKASKTPALLNRSKRNGIPGTEPLRQRSPAHVLHHEKVHCL